MKGLHELESETDPNAASKVLALFYGAIVYAGVWCILLYVVGFVGNFFGPFRGTLLDRIVPLRSIDMGEVPPFWSAFAVNLLVLVIFALQHSVMPRIGFKSLITRYVPLHLERSTYIIFAICALSLLMWQWRAMPQVIWQVEAPALRLALDLVSIAGWLTVLLATVQVGHWKIFGVAQVIDYIQGKPYTRQAYSTLPPEFLEAGWPVTRHGLWQYARHPDFFGFCVAFWVTPTMTAGHLMFALGLTIYIMFGIFFLERNLSDLYGEPYRLYQRVTSRIIPWFVGKSAS